MFTASEVWACSDCNAAKAYGSFVNGEISVANTEVISATAAIQLGFNILIQAVQAMSSNVTTEVNKGARSQKVLLDELNRQQEQRERAKYTIESKNYYEERYGLDNIPLSACEDFINTGNMTITKNTTEAELSDAIDVFLAGYRTASPVNDWEYHQRTLEHGNTKELRFDKALYTSEDVQNAAEYINQTIDPVPVTIINPDRDVETLNADERVLWSSIQTANLRLDAAKFGLKEQLLLKAPIVGGDQSIQGLIEKNAYASLNPDNLVDIAEGSQTKILKTMLRDAQYSNLMAYEILKSELRKSKLLAISVAASLDESRQGLKALVREAGL